MTLTNRRPRRPLPPLYSNRERAYLATLIFAFVALLAAMIRLRDPSIGPWLLGMDKPTPPKSERRYESLASVPEGSAPPEKKIADDSPASTAEAEPIAEVDAPPPPPDPAVWNPLGLVELKRLDEDPARMLGRLRDFRVWNPEDEVAKFWLLAKAASTPPEELAKACRKDVVLTNLLHDPTRFRGAPIRVKGFIRRLVRFDAEPDRNPFGLKNWYEGWIFTGNQTTYPTLLIFAKLPRGLKPSDELSGDVEMDGYFLKDLAFKAESGSANAAPVIVGYEPRWTPPPPGFRIGQGLGLGVALASLLFLAYIALWARSRREEKLAIEWRRRNAGAPMESYHSDATDSPPWESPTPPADSIDDIRPDPEPSP